MQHCSRTEGEETQRRPAAEESVMERGSSQVNHSELYALIRFIIKEEIRAAIETSADT